MKMKMKIKRKMKMKMKIKRKMKMLVQCFGVAAEEVKEREETKEGLREVGWEEIKRATQKGRVVGRGGSSTVYHLEEAEEAVKLVYGRRVFEDELETLRRVGDHPNIVKLKGYARHPEDDQLAALVLDFAPNGTLQDSLLDWVARVRVALQVADALDHLHHRCGPLPVVHGDIKASNVLLDRHLNAVLCDFGSARTGFSSSSSSSSQVMRGSPGYADPHYLRTGIPSKKNDVYSFGVLLLHLLTGAAPFTAATGQLFPFPPPLDPRLQPSHHEAAARLMDLASRCLSHPPALRPDASLISNTISSSLF